MEQIKSQQDKIRGSLVGGAVGDALGYPVEFIDSYEDIVDQYGEQGITRYDTAQSWMSPTEDNGKALISDDTQMTLFTACGLLNAKASGSAPLPCISRAYVEWYHTQVGKMKMKTKTCWITDLPELNARRAPGNTCLTALANTIAGQKPCNDSKGCGGIMRIAPVALYGAAQSRIADITAVDRLAAEASRLTHLHPLGYIPSALIAHAIYRLVQTETPTRDDAKAFIKEGLDMLAELYPEDVQEVQYFVQLVNTAVKLSEGEHEDVSTIETFLGGGWVAEETAAIAIYCTLKYFDNFEQAMIAAVNHAGDSDSTGAVTGNLLGAAIGYAALPEFYKTDLELHDVILHVADDLYLGETTPFCSEEGRP